MNTTSIASTNSYQSSSSITTQTNAQQTAKVFEATESYFAFINNAPHLSSSSTKPSSSIDIRKIFSSNKAIDLNQLDFSFSVSSSSSNEHSEASSLSSSPTTSGHLYSSTSVAVESQSSDSTSSTPLHHPSPANSTPTSPLKAAIHQAASFTMDSLDDSPRTSSQTS